MRTFLGGPQEQHELDHDGSLRGGLDNELRPLLLLFFCASLSIAVFQLNKSRREQEIMRKNNIDELLAHESCRFAALSSPLMTALPLSQCPKWI